MSLYSLYSSTVFWVPFPARPSAASLNINYRNERFIEMENKTATALGKKKKLVVDSVWCQAKICQLKAKAKKNK